MKTYRKEQQVSAGHILALVNLNIEKARKRRSELGKRAMLSYKKLEEYWNKRRASGLPKGCLADRKREED